MLEVHTMDQDGTRGKSRYPLLLEWCPQPGRHQRCNVIFGCRSQSNDSIRACVWRSRVMRRTTCSQDGLFFASPWKLRTPRSARIHLPIWDCGLASKVIAWVSSQSWTCSMVPKGEKASGLSYGCRSNSKSAVSVCKESGSKEHQHRSEWLVPQDMGKQGPFLAKREERHGDQSETKIPNSQQECSKAVKAIKNTCWMGENAAHGTSALTVIRLLCRYARKQLQAIVLEQSPISLEVSFKKHLLGSPMLAPALAIWEWYFFFFHSFFPTVYNAMPTAWPPNRQAMLSWQFQLFASHSKCWWLQQQMLL